MTVADELRLSDVLAAYFSVPLLLSSVYGMNIALPLQNRWYAFLLYVLICVVWAGAVWWVGVRGARPEPLRGALVDARAGERGARSVGGLQARAWRRDGALPQCVGPSCAGSVGRGPLRLRRVVQ